MPVRFRKSGTALERSLKSHYTLGKSQVIKTVNYRTINSKRFLHLRNLSRLEYTVLIYLMTVTETECSSDIRMTDVFERTFQYGQTMTVFQNCKYVHKYYLNHNI